MFAILMLFGALPYLILFHFGFLSFLYFLGLALLRKDFRVHFTITKLVTCLYGVGGGLLLPFMEAYYAAPSHDAPVGTIFFDLPALFTSMLIPLNGIYPWEHHWQTYLLYSAFGVIGGWGLGQSIDRLIQKRKGIILSS